MAGAAPNFSVTGFQLCEVKKPRPNAFHAGNEPCTSETMTPASSTRTAMAEPWVRILKVRSPMRKRRKVRLRCSCSLARPGTGTAWSAISMVLPLTELAQIEIETGAKRCSRLDSDVLVHGGLDVRGPHLLDFGDDALRHGDVI